MGDLLRHSTPLVQASARSEVRLGLRRGCCTRQDSPRCFTMGDLRRILAQTFAEIGL